MSARDIPLQDLADVIRSKNAGPFEVTLDIIFKDSDIFTHVENIELFNRKMIAGLYGLTEADVLKVIHYEPARAIKITLKRSVPSGSVGDRDVYGAQQHAPLLGIEIPVPPQK